MAQKWTNSFRDPASVRNARRKKALEEAGLDTNNFYTRLKGGMT